MQVNLRGAEGMQARLSTGGVTGVSKSGINPMELTRDTYEIYCKLYLTERIYEVIPSTSTAQYGDVSRAVNLVNSSLFSNLRTETNKILLINKIYSLFMEIFNIELAKDYLYKQAVHLSEYDPALYKREV